MKLSSFLLLAPSTNGNVIVRQTHTGSVIEIDPESATWLQSGDFDQFPADAISDLVSLGIIHDDTVDEKAEFLKHYSQTWDGLGTFLLHLVPTTNCQLDCVYCYEDGIDRTKVVSDNKIPEILSWIDSYLAANELHLMRIVWHGGEPLLYPNKLRDTMPSLLEIAERRGIPLETQVVTNGVMATADILEFLSGYNLGRLQITLDGPPEVHDSRRYRRGTKAGSFAEIHSNMLAALNQGFVQRIDVRVNLDIQNQGKLERLFAILAADGVQDNIHLSLGIITNTLPNESCSGGANNYFDVYGFSEDQAVEEYLKVAALAKSYGFQPPGELIVGPWCVARHPHAWTVGPDGEIYKCLSTVGRPEHVVGHLPEVPSNDAVTSYTLRRIADCLDQGCNMVPICGGGCLFEEKVNGTTNCPKALLQRVNAGLLTLEHGQ
ncbi:radical SAM protein [Patescibacteria group bacterium]|nr:radical SAM protein [Patescibacteria group bacterium]